jgi:hypothetical protein
MYYIVEITSQGIETFLEGFEDIGEAWDVVSGEGIPVGLIPPHVLTAPPLDADTIVPTLYDPEDFATLYHADKDRAIALVAAMTGPQRVLQALAYCAWLACHGLEIDLATVLAPGRSEQSHGMALECTGWQDEHTCLTQIHAPSIVRVLQTYPRNDDPMR